jgi:hypothetical protein
MEQKAAGKSQNKEKMDKPPTKNLYPPTGEEAEIEADVEVVKGKRPKRFELGELEIELGENAGAQIGSCAEKSTTIRGRAPGVVVDNTTDEHSEAAPLSPLDALAAAAAAGAAPLPGSVVTGGYPALQLFCYTSYKQINTHTS